MPVAVGGVCALGKAIAQQDLRRAKAIDHGNRDLIAALLAVASAPHGAASSASSGPRACTDDGVLPRVRQMRRASTGRWQSMSLHHRRRPFQLRLLVDRRFRIEQERHEILDLLFAQHLVDAEARHVGAGEHGLRSRRSW